MTEARKTVLFVDHATALGGAEHSLLLLLKHLDRTRVQAHLAAAEGPLARRARALGIPVHPAPLPRLRGSPTWFWDGMQGVMSLARLAREVGADVLYGNTVRASVYTAAAARLVRRDFIWHMRDFWLSETEPRFVTVDRWGKRALCAAATHVIANSRATAQHLPCPGRVTVIYNGVELSLYDPRMDGLPFRQAHSIPRDAAVVGMVGRLRPWKGQKVFLRVLAAVQATHPDVWGVIVGGTPFGVEDAYPQELRALAHTLGVADRVVFTGHLEDVRPALAAMDLLVHPGDPEPFGRVVIEAMAMARPVVAFAQGALPEILRHGQTGFLVQPGDEEEMVAHILRLLRNPEQARRMGEEARRHVEARFTAERTAREVEALLLGDGRRTDRA